MGGSACFVLALSHILPGLSQIAEDEALDALNGEGMVGGDGLGEFHSLVHELVGGDEVVEEAEAVGFVGFDDASGVEEFLGAGPADDDGEGPGGVHLSVGDGEEAELAAWAADEEVEGAGEDGAAAVGEAVEGADDGFGAVGDALLGVGADFGGLGGLLRGEGTHFVDVGAGGEGSVAGAGEDDGADFVVGFQVGYGGAEFPGEGEVHGVQHLGAVEGDGGDAIFAVDDYGVVVHGWFACCRVGISVGWGWCVDMIAA